MNASVPSGWGMRFSHVQHCCFGQAAHRVLRSAHTRACNRGFDVKRKLYGLLRAERTVARVEEAVRQGRRILTQEAFRAVLFLNQKAAAVVVNGTNPLRPNLRPNAHDRDHSNSQHKILRFLKRGAALEGMQ